MARYPHLVKDDVPEFVVPDGPATGGRSDGKVRSTGDGVTRTILQQKFPALRGR